MAAPDQKKPFKLYLGLWKEVADTVAGIADVFDVLRDQMNSRFDDVDKRLSSVESGQRKLDVGQAHLKDQINGLKADLSDTPSRRQFEKLKARVDRYHPV